MTDHTLPTPESERDNAAAAPSAVDWDLAASTGARIVPAGPKASRIEIKDLVSGLRRAAVDARPFVAETAQLSSPDTAPAIVVDRPGWVRANAASMGAMLSPALSKATQRRDGKTSSPTGRAMAARVSGLEAGGLLAFLASRVLGQYDLAPQGDPRLMLVAPNILDAERELGVNPADFRLWVCLHEETHRVQFTAVPWLRDHMLATARDLATDLVPDPDELAERLQRMTANLPDVLSGKDPQGISGLVLDDEQRARVADVTAVMSLLEGHADVVMDAVGPEVVPSVAQIREQFSERRQGRGSLDKFVRRLLGFEAKIRQYEDGAQFVREVQAKVGVEGFNAVWDSPQTLPTAAEVADPQAWVARVHG